VKIVLYFQALPSNPAYLDSNKTSIFHRGGKEAAEKSIVLLEAFKQNRIKPKQDQTS